MLSLVVKFIILASLWTFLQAGDVWIKLSDPSSLPKSPQDAGVATTLPFDIILFNERIPAATTLWISSNGYISIDKQFSSNGFRKVELPLATASEDPIVISPFKARMQYRPDDTEDALASVTYTFDLSGNSLEQVQNTINSLVVGADQFKVTNSFAVAWEDISFFGGDPASTPYPRNTFQFILVTDGLSTYGIFNYKSIVWDGGYVSGGDSRTGTGATNPPAQAGINLGGGKGFFKLSYGPNILDIDNYQASEHAGQYVLELSSRRPQEHGCSIERKDDTPLHLYPSSGPMFGGNPIEVSEACFKPDQEIKCQFGDQEVVGVYSSPSRALCYAPTFYGSGRIPFKLLMNGEEIKSGETYYFASSHISNGISLTDIDSWRSIKPSDNLEFTWNPADLRAESAKLDVKLLTYHENSTVYEWREEYIIDTGIENTGSYSFNTSTLNCTSQCEDKMVGSVVVELLDSPDSNTPGRLWSDVGALGWYAHEQLIADVGMDWPDKMCYDWFLRDNAPDGKGLEWLDELQHCPCTKDQAVADIGRFIPDPGCSMYNKKSSYNCYYHQSAEHCVRSIWPSKPTGAGTQCCYGVDGNLLYAGDSIYGSTVDKGHSQGAAPYNAAGHIPGLSHWVHDVITYQYCCLWNTIDNMCGVYMGQRPTMDCDKYQSIHTAAIYGAGHAEGFDGSAHKETGSGDFTLLKTSDDVDVQARLKTASDGSGAVVTGLVMKAPGASTVEIILHKPSKVSTRTTIKVDNNEQMFTEPAWYKQQFNGVMISSWNLKPITDHSNFTITFESGLGIRVTASNSNLNAIVTITRKLKEGLIAEALLGSTPTASKAIGSLFSTAAGANTDEATGDVDTDLMTESQPMKLWYDVMKQSAKPVLSCGMPLLHGTRNGSSYMEGSVVELTGCKHGYDLFNHSPGQLYTCQSNGSWHPPILTTCNYSGFPEFTPRVLMLVETTTLWDPKIVPDKVALPLALSMVLIIILTFFLAALVYSYKKGMLTRDKHEDVVEVPSDTENLAYTMASTGSMKLNPAVTNGYHTTQQMLDMDDTLRMKSYRVAVDSYEADYADDYSSYHSQLSVNGHHPHYYQQPNTAYQQNYTSSNPQIIFDEVQ